MKKILIKIIPVIGTMLTSICAGLLASMGSVKFVGAFVASLIALFFLFSPEILFGVTLLTSLVFAGLAEYYAGIGQANWIPSLLALTLIAASFLARFKYDNRLFKFKMTGVSWLIVFYLIILIATSLLNQNSFVQMIVGMRIFLPFLGIYLALVFIGQPEKLVRRLVLIILGVSAIQLPVVLHQAIVMGPIRQSIPGAIGGIAEAIVGTFGGNLVTGGYTGELAVFMLIASGMALVLRPVLTYGRALSWFIPLTAITTVGLAETKIFFILTPFALCLVFFEEISSSPKKLFGLLFGMVVALGLLGSIYAWRFWSVDDGEFLHAFTYSFDPNFMVDQYHRGRVAALFYWWDVNITRFDLFHVLLGYGMGSTLEASSILGQGNAVKQYGLGLDPHALSKLLWDSGVLGTTVFITFLIRSGLNAHRLVGSVSIPEFHTRTLKASRAAIFCFIAMLAYQPSVFGGAAVQCLFWFFIGYIEYWNSQTKRVNQ